MSQSEETKIAVAQEQIKTVQADVKIILSNHLPHIYDELKKLRQDIVDGNESLNEKVTSLRVTMAWYVGIAVGAVGLINILVTLFHR